MHDQRFFDQTLDLIEAGQLSMALPLLAGRLFAARIDRKNWLQTRTLLEQHPLHSVLMEDPFAAYCRGRPRGYPGDAGLIDMIYDRQPPSAVDGRAATIFAITTGFPASEAVRLRREHAEQVVMRGWEGGKRILVLACGHFREADRLAGKDLSAITVVDQDPESLGRVRALHGDRINIREANVFRYLRGAVTRGERFDIVYTLGLTDYLDDRAMRLLHRLVHTCTEPGGTFLLANFRPDHLGTGWMEAVMDWHLIYRDDTELADFAREAGFEPETWHDATGAVVWCEMVAR